LICALAVTGFTLAGCAYDCSDDGPDACGFGPPPGYTGDPSYTEPSLPCGMAVAFEGRLYKGHWVEKVALGPRVGQAVAAPCDNPLQADHPAYPGGVTGEPPPGPPLDVYGIDGAGPDEALVSAAQDGGGGYWIWVDSRTGYTEQGKDGVIEHLEILGSGG
jgi:hypothetical protein